MPHTLIVLRHAKSDWDRPVPDRERPLGNRGRRQAPATGRWLAAEGLIPDLAIVSPAERATATWTLVAGQLGAEVPTRSEESAYTFDGSELVDLVRATPDAVRTLAIVGHNPAVEELVEDLTGTPAAMPTSACAVIELASWSGGPGTARLVYAGRPADGGW